MGRKKKENRVHTTTVGVSDENLECINSFKKVGETQNECIGRILSQFRLVGELQDERNAWEQEAKEWKTKYYNKSSTCASLQSRVEELEQVLREQEIKVSTS